MRIYGTYILLPAFIHLQLWPVSLRLLQIVVLQPRVSWTSQLRFYFDMQCEFWDFTDLSKICSVRKSENVWNFSLCVIVFRFIKSNVFFQFNKKNPVVIVFAAPSSGQPPTCLSKVGAVIVSPHYCCKFKCVILIYIDYFSIWVNVWSVKVVYLKYVVSNVGRYVTVCGWRAGRRRGELPCFSAHPPTPHPHWTAVRTSEQRRLGWGKRQRRWRGWWCFCSAWSCWPLTLVGDSGGFSWGEQFAVLVNYEVNF